MSDGLPLAGLRVLVLRALHQAGTLSEKLIEVGGFPHLHKKETSAPRTKTCSRRPRDGAPIFVVLESV